MVIDFVIPWVDGSDKDWLKDKQLYSVNDDNTDSGINRYRDWNLLKYWFRGVERNAPWVNKIFFVTCGQVPEWLNVNHDKMILINHKDYIPEKYLPTFSANPIELNLHRIEELSEHFVYFNDDMFLINKCEKEDFFINDLPCDLAVEEPYSFNDRDVFNDILINNIIAINTHFNRKEILKKYSKKIYCIKNIKSFIKNMSLSLLKREDFFGFEYSHLPQPFLKSMYEKIWDENGEWLNETCSNRFRSRNDLNQYLIKYYQFLTGNFTPYNWRKSGVVFHLDDLFENNVDMACNVLISKQYKMICLNDCNVTDFEKTSDKILKSLEKIMPEKSKFEL